MWQGVVGLLFVLRRGLLGCTEAFLKVLGLCLHPEGEEAGNKEVSWRKK